MTAPIDILAFSPHPDDAELYCAGTLLACKRAGQRIGIVDLTRGELSTRGTLASRARESAAASRILGLDARVNLGLPDGDIANSKENRLAVTRTLRALRPAAVLLPYPVDRHPDHVNASTLVREALFQSGLAKVRTRDGSTTQAPHRPARAFYYMLTHDFTPQFVIDISAEFDTKMEAVRCYATQFHTGAAQEGAQTYVSTPDFMESLIARSRRLGFHIGARYGEGFESLGVLGIPVSGLFERS
jgi:bacillithiol biosynthesis deacetylase BshB1